MLDISYGMYLLVIAPFIGSFIGVLVLRIPAGEPIVIARSKCQNCDTQLKAIDLVPILSWLLLKGKCRHCNVGYGHEHLMYEFGALIIALWVTLYIPHQLQWVGCLFGWTIFTIAAIDYKFFVLPDLLTIPLLISGLAIVYQFDKSSLYHHVLGGVIGYSSLSLVSFIYSTIKKKKGMGGGDPKLFAAIGTWVGWVGLPSVLIFSCMTAFIYLGFKKAIGDPTSLDEKIPFGTHLSIGAWIVWIYGPLSINQ